MPEAPEFLQLLRKYPGKLQTQVGVRMLFLTGVRTGELRLATPDQFHLDDALWIIPPDVVKQLELKMQKENLRTEDIPPYIVPLSVQAVEIVRHMLDRFKKSQKYLFPGAKSLKQRISENTLNGAIKRLGYAGRLTGMASAPRSRRRSTSWAIRTSGSTRSFPTSTRTRSVEPTTMPSTSTSVST